MIRSRVRRGRATRPRGGATMFARGVSRCGVRGAFRSRRATQANAASPERESARPRGSRWGAGPEQQQRADLARQTLEKDSTNLAARIELANVLYDTGNWSEAIVHYKTAARLDPARSTTVVDLGVCYYNLSAVATAESLFHRAIAMDSHQAVAMFNLGIIAETRERWDEALAQYRHALE